MTSLIKHSQNIKSVNYQCIHRYFTKQENKKWEATLYQIEPAIHGWCKCVIKYLFSVQTSVAAPKQTKEAIIKSVNYQWMSRYFTKQENQNEKTTLYHIEPAFPVSLLV